VFTFLTVRFRADGPSGPYCVASMLLAIDYARWPFVLKIVTYLFIVNIVSYCKNARAASAANARVALDPLAKRGE
jgi:hypothetical protein